ncbi:MAG: hypothetical protein Q8S04_06005, partial [Bacteroidales bacterium]|nr:hypothetical protein [Bacteroidales bacterium]
RQFCYRKLNNRNIFYKNLFSFTTVCCQQKNISDIGVSKGKHWLPKREGTHRRWGGFSVLTP